MRSESRTGDFVRHDSRQFAGRRARVAPFSMPAGLSQITQSNISAQIPPDADAERLSLLKGFLVAVCEA